MTHTIICPTLTMIEKNVFSRARARAARARARDSALEAFRHNPTDQTIVRVLYQMSESAVPLVLSWITFATRSHQ